jgi:TonB family protein
MIALKFWLFNYLVNALWQVPLLFAAAWLAARAVRRAGPLLEHRLWVCTLLAQVTLPACTLRPAQLLTAFARLMHRASAASSSSDARITVTMGAAHTPNAFTLPTPWLNALLALYAIVLLVLTVRLAISLHRTAALRCLATLPPAGSCLPHLAAHCARLFSVHGATIACSSQIASPVTLGIRRRTLLVPTALEGNVLHQDLEAALAHEFAHMQRHDFAWNLLFELLSLPIALHPLTCLTRRRLADSRERTCDALAAAALSGRESYAQSLLRLAATLTLCNHAAMPAHAIGIFPANSFPQFERRIMNLTQASLPLRGLRRITTVALALTLGLAACTSALALRLQVAAPAPQTASPLTPHPAPGTTFLLTVPHPVNSAPATFTVDVQPTTPPDPSAEASQPAQPGTTRQLAETAEPAVRIKVLSPPYTQPAESQSNEPAPVSAEAMAGNVLSKVTPVYPQAAKDARIAGAVILDAVIGKDGNITSLKILSGPEELRHSAWNAVSQWVYKPYLLNGEPVEVETTITVNYTLNN